MSGDLRMISFSTFSEAWLSRLTELVNFGKAIAPRNQGTVEQLAISFTVDNPLSNILVHPIRNPSYRFMVAEWLWIMAGANDVATLARYAKRMLEFSDNGVTLAGAYGPRLMPQVDYLLRWLKNYPDTRQAVATIWTPNPTPSRDTPCTLAIQLLNRNGLLHGIVTMRSSDVWLGLPYDFFSFSMILNALAGELALEVGSLTFNLGSSHLYDRNWGEADKVIKYAALMRCGSSPRLPGRPPAAWILTAGQQELDPSPTNTPDTPWDRYVSVLRAHNNAEAGVRLMEEVL